MTEWRKEVKRALQTIPKDTPNCLKAAMAKAKLTYKKGSSSSAASYGMKKSHKRGRGHRRSGKGRKGMRKSGRSRKHKGGAMSKLSPGDYDGKGVGTSGPGVQIEAATKST